MSSVADLHRHTCVLFDGPEGFDALAAEVVAAAEAANEEALVLREDDARDWYAQIARGAGEDVIASFAQAAFDARTKGFWGLRAVADVTGLVESAEHRTAYEQYEVAVDRWMHRSRMATGVCAIDARRVDPDVVLELCSLHEWSAPPVDFRLLPDTDPSVLHVVGELDRSTFSSLSHLLPVMVADGPPVVDMRDCTFIDHRSLRLIAEMGAGAHGRVRLVEPSSAVRRLVQILELDVEITAT